MKTRQVKKSTHVNGCQSLVQQWVRGWRHWCLAARQLCLADGSGWLWRWGEVNGNEGKRSGRRGKRIESWWQNHGCAPSAAQLQTANQRAPSACQFHPAAQSAPAPQVQNAIRRSDAEDVGGRAAGSGVTRARRPACRRSRSCTCRLAAVIRFFFALSSKSKLKGDEACSLSSAVFSCFAAISHFNFKPCPLSSPSTGAVTS